MDQIVVAYRVAACSCVNDFAIDSLLNEADASLARWEISFSSVRNIYVICAEEV